MFFSLSKNLIFLTDPLFYILFIAFIGILKSKKRFFLILFFIPLYLLSTPLVSNKIFLKFENLKHPSIIKKQYDAVVVLSGMVDLKLSKLENIEFGGGVDRVLKGIDLVKSKNANFLVLSGGDGSLIPTKKSEANILADFSKKMGVPGDKIIIDKDSRNTYENALNVKEITINHNLKDVLLVTSAFHMFRAVGCFKQQGIEVDLLPVDYQAHSTNINFHAFIPSTSALSLSNTLIHESVGIIVYGLTEKAKYF